MLIVACSTAPKDATYGARMHPVFESGAPIGLRFSHVVPDGCIASLGIRDGDLLVGVDDQPISSIHDYVRFLNAIGEFLPFSMQLRGEDGDSRELRADGCGLAPTVNPI